MNVSRDNAGWTAGRVVAMVLASIGAIIGATLLLIGLALVVAHAFARDSDGYYTTDTERLVTPTYALTVEDIDLGSEPADAIPKGVLGRVRIRSERPDGRPVFVGIGPERDVDSYLRGVAHAEVEDFDPPKYRTRPGAPPRRPPGAERFWVASAQGQGRQTVTWEVEGGRWAVVGMNAGGARGVVLNTDVGAKIGWFLWVGIGLLVIGLLLVAGMVALILALARRSATPPAAGAAAPRPRDSLPESAS